MGEKAPKAWHGAWLGVEVMYRFSTCELSCPGPEADHTIRYLVGRSTNETLGALHAAEHGFYDAAIGSLRLLWEKVSLVALLLADTEALAVYATGNRAAQRTAFQPSQVRAKLRALGSELVDILERYYRLATERSVHPYRDQLELGHHPAGLLVGPAWQFAGFGLAMNELATVSGMMLIEIVRPDSGRADTEVPMIREALYTIADGLGGLWLDSLPPALRHRTGPATSDAE